MKGKEFEMLFVHLKRKGLPHSTQRMKDAFSEVSHLRNQKEPGCLATHGRDEGQAAVLGCGPLSKSLWMQRTRVMVMGQEWSSGE